MVIYKKEDAELTIPNGIGNLNITVNDENLNGYATISYVDDKYDELINKIAELEKLISDK